MKSQNRLAVIDIEAVKSRMLTVRSQQVLLDRDVAELYGVQTKEINQAVRNNPDIMVGLRLNRFERICHE